MITFIGMGHLGANFVQAMLKKGEKVNVWNRTASKAKELEAFGARAFDNIVDAVRGSNRIHLTLKDDAAVDEILEQASAGFDKDTIIIDHTTTSAAGAAKRTAEWKQRGYTYLHAPVFMGPQNALESTGFMMVSGDEKLITMLEPELAKMTGKVLKFGTDTNKSSGIKLLGNLFLIAVTGGIADMLALAKTLGISTEEVLTLFASWNPGTAVPARIQKMTSNTFDQPTWELSMARKDAGLMLQAAAQGGATLFAIAPIAAEMDRWIAKGHGHEDWTVIGKGGVA